MEIKVIKDRILVELINDQNSKEATKMFIATNPDQKTQYEGKVLKVGTGTKDESMEVKIGDTVVFHKNGCYGIDVDDKEYYVLTQSQVIAILN